MGSLRSGIALPTLGMLAVLGVAAAQAQVPEQQLTQPTASFPYEFSTVAGLRELPDGRVMVADGLGQVLMVLDMAVGRADTIGRPGQGPREYRQPDGLFALPGDSTLLVDLGNGRLTVLGPDFSFGATTPISQGSVEPGRGMGTMSIRIPRAVDSRGRFYYQPMGGMGRGGMMPDSAAVVRWDRATGAVDTLAQVKLQDFTSSTSGGINNQAVSISAVPMSPQDAWAAGPDGSIAIARAGDYSVEWVRPDGSVVRGPANDYNPVRVGRDEKQAWVERSARSGLRVQMAVENGRVSTSFGRGGRARDDWEQQYPEWPEVMPAFQPNGVFVTPDGQMWVERYVAAAEPPTFDVFDSAGRMVKRISFSPGRRLVGFGRTAVYLVSADEFDLLRLEKYEF